MTHRVHLQVAATGPTNDLFGAISTAHIGNGFYRSTNGFSEVIHYAAGRAFHLRHFLLARLTHFSKGHRNLFYCRSIPQIRISLIMGGLTLARSFSPMAILSAFFALLAGSFRSRTALQIETLALRHQLNVLQRLVKRPRLNATDRWLWAWPSRNWPEWRRVLVIVKADTVIGWQRKGFVFLDVEKSRWSTWKTSRGGGFTAAHPPDESREPTLGSAEDTRRAAETRYRDQRIHCKQIFGPTPRIAFAELENFFGESRERHSFRGLLYGSDDSVSDSLCLPRPGTRTPSHPPLPGHAASDGGVNCTATTGGLSLGHGAMLSLTRSGSYLWTRVRGTGAGNRYRTSSFHTALSVAACVRRTTDRNDSPRVPRSRHRGQ